MKSLKDENASTHNAAASALGEISPPVKNAVSALKELLKDEDEDVQKSAAEALKKIEAGKK